jgi:hypothetical protein
MRTIKQIVALLLMISLGLPTSLHAQLASPAGWAALDVLRVDNSIEVRMADGRKVKGDFVAVEAGSISVHSNGKVLQIHAADVARVDRLQLHVGRATLIGTAIGAAGGAVVGAAGVVVIPCLCRPSRAQNAAGFAIVFAIPGAIIGMVIGSIHHHHELIYSR